MNILLIQLKRIGDLVLTTPALAALRTKFPDAKITLAISHECAALVPALVDVDRTIVMRRGFGDFGNYMSILRAKFDYCVDFTRNDRSASLAFLSRAEKRIVSYRVKRRSPLRRKAYNEFVQHRMRDMHTIDYNLSLLEPLGISGTIPPVQLQLPNDAREKASALRRHGKIDNQFVIFHPGSARAEKFWEPERWAEVIEHARTRWGIDCVLTGGNFERGHLAEIKAKLHPPGTGPVVVDLSGKTDLLTLAALIEQARLLITVDSAPMHLAAALQKPQVILFGPTNPFHWRPRESPAVILQGESPEPQHEFASRQTRLSMKQISTQAVINAMDSLLSTPTP
ncbi:MAG: putative lipopolysaccharide heptosyltransferase III [Spartobacteria bacterium]